MRTVVESRGCLPSVIGPHPFGQQILKAAQNHLGKHFKFFGRPALRQRGPRQLFLLLVEEAKKCNSYVIVDA
jgi:hypothetical protein